MSFLSIKSFAGMPGSPGCTSACLAHHSCPSKCNCNVSPSIYQLCPALHSLCSTLSATISHDGSILKSLNMIQIQSDDRDEGAVGEAMPEKQSYSFRYQVSLLLFQSCNSINLCSLRYINAIHSNYSSLCLRHIPRLSLFVGSH